MKKIRRCPECKSEIKPGNTELIYDLKERKITIKNVPANICSKCGEVFIPARVASEVNRMINRIAEDIDSFIKNQPQIDMTKRKMEIAIAI